MITCEFEQGRKAVLRHVTVDAIVVKDKRILLVKRAERLVEGGKFALPGGFLDRNETSKEGALRELKEETGYTAESARLFLINDEPARGSDDRQNVTFVYLVEAGERIGDPDDEIEKLEWFDISDLPARNKMAFDHHAIIGAYLDYRKKEFPIPRIGM